jgi:hypothetical protein
MDLTTLTNLRINADMLIQLAAQQKTSANKTAAWRSLQLAKAWLGVLKGEMGAENPYTPPFIANKNYGNGDGERAYLPNPDPLAIPPTNDVYCGDMSNHKTSIVWLYYMRESIDILMRSVKDCLTTNTNLELELLGRKALAYLQEASFYYGFELADMRDAAVAQAAQEAAAADALAKKQDGYRSELGNNPEPKTKNANL